MTDLSNRPVILIPTEIADLVGRISAGLAPSTVWLFGSRARGDAGPASNWDIAVVLPDDSPHDVDDPLLGWTLAQACDADATVLTMSEGDLSTGMDLPNTLGRRIADEGLRIDVQ